MHAWPVREANISMRNTITVMNAKGGVGKSTLVLALAETLATVQRKRVLVIDADAQASVSHMLVLQPQLEAAQSGGRTIVDYLIDVVLKESTASWQDFVISDVSDVSTMRAPSRSSPATRISRCSSAKFRRETLRRDFADQSAPCLRKRVKGTTSS